MKITQLRAAFAATATVAAFTAVTAPAAQAGIPDARVSASESKKAWPGCHEYGVRFRDHFDLRGRKLFGALKFRVDGTSTTKANWLCEGVAEPWWFNDQSSYRHEFTIDCPGANLNISTRPGITITGGNRKTIVLSERNFVPRGEQTSSYNVWFTVSGCAGWVDIARTSYLTVRNDEGWEDQISTEPESFRRNL